MAGRPPKAGKSEWATAAHRLLIEVGPAALTVEGIARELGVTKGSFYWHFENRDELLTAALQVWQSEQTQALIDETEAGGGSPLDRIQALFMRVAKASTAARGEMIMYTTSSGNNDALSEALQRVSHARIEYVASLLREHGLEQQAATDRAKMALALVIGQRVLALAVPELALTGAARDRMVQQAIALVTG